MVMPLVVVGVDGSEESLRAVEWAALEAERHRSPLRIVSAPAMPPRMRARYSSPRTVADVLREVSRLVLRAAVTRAEEISPCLLIDTVLLSGPPALAVTGSGCGALMLVVGSQGTSGLAAALIGSVSRHAAMHASCPVVVVREETTAVHREVAVGIRDARDITGALAFGFEEAALRGAGLVAVHACHRFPSARGGPARTSDAAGHPVGTGQSPAEASRNLAAAVSGWQERYPAVTVRCDVVHGRPARVLARYSAQEDLLVIGMHHGRGTGQLLNSVERALLTHLRGPVAVIPENWVPIAA